MHDDSTGTGGEMKDGAEPGVGRPRAHHGLVKHQVLETLRQKRCLEKKLRHGTWHYWVREDHGTRRANDQELLA